MSRRSDSEDMLSYHMHRGDPYYSFVDRYGHEPFADYRIKSNEPGPAFYGFILFYTILAFLLIGPLVSWSRAKEEKEVKVKVKESNQKEVDIEQDKDPDTQMPSTEEQSSSEQAPESFLIKGGKGGKTEITKDDKQEHNHTVQNSAGGNQKIDIKKQSSSSFVAESDLFTKNSRQTVSKSIISSSRSRKLKSVVLREFDQSYPDQDPDFQHRIALRFPAEIGAGRADEQISPFSKTNNNNSSSTSDGRSGGAGSNEPTETSSSIPSSSVPSAATTGKIQQKTSDDENTLNPSDKSFSKRLLDVGGRRWKNRRPIGRADVIENSFASSSVRQMATRKTQIGGSLASRDDKKISATASSQNKGEQTSIPQPPNLQRKTSKSMSDIASSILSEQYHQLNHQPEIQVDISLLKKHQLEQLRLQQQYQNQHHLQFFAMQRLQQQNQRRFPQPRRFSRFGNRSVSEQSASVMSSIVDDISPEDAADANDPGRGNVFIQPDENYRITETEFNEGCGTDFGPAREGCCATQIDGFLMLAVPDIQKWNLFKTSIPLTMGASSESLFRLVIIAFISQFLGTKAMIAFLLVGLFVKLTSEELSSAIIDALSAFVQASVDKTSIDTNKSNYVAGQYIQLAFLLQVLLNVPLLVSWVLFMEPFVIWLVADPMIANLASEYTAIVVFGYMVQALSRTITVVFHICGHEHFESIIDLVAGIVQVVAVACVLTLAHEASLNTIGGIQALISIAAAIAKIAYPASRGWMAPFRKGLVQNVALCNHGVGIWHLFKAVGPLLLGTILEYGEWNLLTLFVRHLGTAEVAAWALLGAFWDFFEALTEGIGEAAANQVTYLLSVGRVECAKKLSYGAIYMAVTQSVLVTSALYMSGQYLAVLFSCNPAIQHMMNNSIILIGLANVIMAFSQIAWSLIGAQGRFRLATFVIFFSRWMVTMPCALVCIYVFGFDLNAVSGSLVVGYATACCALTVIVLRSDWDRLAPLMQVMNQPLVIPAVQNVADKKTAVDGNIDPDDPILGLVDIDNFDDSDDDSDGFGFGDYTDTGDETTTKPSASGSKDENREEN